MRGKRRLFWYVSSPAVFVVDKYKADTFFCLKLTSASTVLAEAPPSVSKYATTALEKLNVTIKTSTSVISTTALPKGGQALHLSDGETIMADMYIPASGLIPNSSFVPARYLDDAGFIVVDTHLNLKDSPDIWALGDISDTEYMQFISCDRQSVYVAKSVVGALSGRGKIPTPYKSIQSRKSSSPLCSSY